MELKVGKYYKTRDGRKAVIYNLNSGHPKYPVHGAINNGTYWVLESFVSTGHNWDCATVHPNDLISEWKDEPVVDWSKLPSNAKAVAMSLEGNPYFRDHIPTITTYGWIGMGFAFPCPPDACSFSGDWRDSLVIRPEVK